MFTETGFSPNALLAIMSFYLNMQLFRGSGKGSDEDFVAQTKQLFKPKSCNNCARLRRIKTQNAALRRKGKAS